MRGDALRRGHRWTAGALVMGTLALGGCTGDPGPGPTGSASTSASPTAAASPSPTPIVAPVRPAEMERSDEVGALAAAEYFMELYAYTFRTGDLTEWNAVSGQTCGFCSNARAEVERVYGAGGRFVGGGLEDLDEVRVVGVDEQLVVFGVQLRYAYAEGSEVSAAADVVDQIAPDEGYVVLDVAPSVRGWILMGGAAQDGPVG